MIPENIFHALTCISVRHKNPFEILQHTNLRFGLGSHDYHRNCHKSVKVSFFSLIYLVFFFFHLMFCLYKFLRTKPVQSNRSSLTERPAGSVKTLPLVSLNRNVNQGKTLPIFLPHFSSSCCHGSVKLVEKRRSVGINQSGTDADRNQTVTKQNKMGPWYKKCHCLQNNPNG